MIKLRIIHTAHSAYKSLAISQRNRLQATLAVILIASLFEFLYIYSLYPALQSVLGQFTSTESGWKDTLNGSIPVVDWIANNPLGVAMLTLIVLTALRCISSYRINSTVSKIAAELTAKAYSGIFGQDYEEIVSNQPSNIAALLTTRCNLLQHLIQQYLSLVSGLLSVVIITLGLIGLSPQVTFLVAAVTSLAYYIVIVIINPKIKSNGAKLLEYLRLQQFYVSESLSSLRDICMNNRKDYYMSEYISNEENLRKTEQSSSFYMSLPKILIEGSFMWIIIALLMWSSANNRDLGVVASIGMLVVAVQRLLPAAQQSYIAFSTISQNIYALEELLGYTKRIKACHKQFDDTLDDILSDTIRTLELKNVSYRYNNAKSNILENVTMLIESKGVIGIYGKSGSGKTTLIDIICGLLSPLSGSIKINGRNNLSRRYLKHNLNRSVSYCTQEPNLIKGTLLENIAFKPVHLINSEEMNKVYQLINICDLNLGVEGWDILDFRINEQGSNLSGGQKQKIGIARALLMKKDFVVFDEPTNGLDPYSKHMVLNLLKTLSESISVIIVTHDQSAIAICDKTYELKNKTLVQSLS